jgi:hypothetical protein
MLSALAAGGIALEGNLLLLAGPGRTHLVCYEVGRVSEGAFLPRGMGFGDGRVRGQAVGGRG